ncbi:hypothetical protein BN903_198 [Halorubrum sp. AJ67]|nr:hypothetical protein BN903_198 [Halorubrum sp. AJ67]
MGPESGTREVRSISEDMSSRSIKMVSKMIEYYSDTSNDLFRKS